MNFLITVDRYKKAKDWTISKFSFSGAFYWKGRECTFQSTLAGYGIEDEVRGAADKKIHGEMAIPAGKYSLSLTYSPKFTESYYRDDEGNILEKEKRTTPDLKKRFHTPHELVLINSIPGFARVLIHWGNTDDDTEGCYIVGSYVGKKGNQDAVLESRKKYREVYPIIWRAIKSGAKTEIELK